MQIHIDPDITRAETLPSNFYKSSEVFELLKEKIFSRSWHLVAKTEDLAPGSAIPVNLLEGFMDEPLLITMDEMGTIRCLSNVCTHRGNLLIDEKKNCKNLVCRYHGRRFGMDGKFEFMPEFEKAVDFPRDREDLESYKTFQWGQILFSSLDPLFDIGKIFDSISSRVGFLGIDRFKFDREHSQTYELEANWALYCDNFLEGFHIPFVHRDLNQLIDYSDYSIELGDFFNVQIGSSEDPDICFDFPDHHPDKGKNIAAYYYWIFPNLMLNFYPWGLSVNIVEPVSSERSRIRFLTFVGDPSKLNHGAGADLHKVEMEDEEVVLSVQKGISSRAYHTGRFSPDREQGVHHFHLLISQSLNGTVEK